MRKLPIDQLLGIQMVERQTAIHWFGIRRNWRCRGDPRGDEENERFSITNYEAPTTLRVCVCISPVQ